MMATADGIAAGIRARAVNPQTFRRPLGALLIASAALLSACGGGGDDPDAPPDVVGPPAPTCSDTPRPPSCL